MLIPVNLRLLVERLVRDIQNINWGIMELFGSNTVTPGSDKVSTYFIPSSVYWRCNNWKFHQQEISTNCNGKNGNSKTGNFKNWKLQNLECKYLKLVIAKTKNYKKTGTEKLVISSTGNCNIWNVRTGNFKKLENEIIDTIEVTC